MGAIQSFATAEVAITAVAAVGALGFWYFHSDHARPSADAAQKGTQNAVMPGKKSRKGKHASKTNEAVASDPASTSKAPAAEPIIVPFPAVLPGGFDDTPADTESSAKPKKPKKKKGKKTAGTSSIFPADNQSESSAGDAPALVSSSNAGPSSATPSVKVGSSSKKAPLVPRIPAEEPWTRVETKPRRTTAEPLSAPSVELTTSDAGITTSVTGNSSPATEKTEDELHPTTTTGRRKTLAEKLAPKPRKTGVEDMLETPDYPELARVMRVSPLPDEKPIAGYSWGDYEDVHVSDMGGAEGGDADGEDDGGWGVVKSRGRPRAERSSSSAAATTSHSIRASETMTKKQRQNAAKREALKVSKAEGEIQRREIQAKHQRELERERMNAQLAAIRGMKKGLSGGMTASVDGSGKMIWD